jgi:hypothetical protein
MLITGLKTPVPLAREITPPPKKATSWSEVVARLFNGDLKSYTV